MPLKSMTAFATRTGSDGPFSWQWDLRGVNGKGLDLRLRIPDWVDGVEQALRSGLTGALKRGNVQGSLKISRLENGASSINEAAVGEVISALKSIEALAAASGVTLAPTRAADILAMRSATEGAGDDAELPALAVALKAEIAPLIEAFAAMRAEEGAALQDIIEGQLAGIAGLVAQAEALLPDRQAAQRATFQSALARVMNETEIDEQRLAQEVAQIAIKSDVMEEIDRLKSHIEAARALLAKDEPVGRKLDFLMQEFNREANTLCSKSGDTALTAIGLDLKVAIDQMREQIQNVE
ncbi:MAG: YicC/YloC family endoribonuclease [Pseudomonadota bacterium]